MSLSGTPCLVRKRNRSSVDRVGRNTHHSVRNDSFLFPLVDALLCHGCDVQSVWIHTHPSSIVRFSLVRQEQAGRSA